MICLPFFFLSLSLLFNHSIFIIDSLLLFLDPTCNIGSTAKFMAHIQRLRHDPENSIAWFCPRHYVRYVYGAVTAVTMMGFNASGHIAGETKKARYELSCTLIGAFSPYFKSHRG